jgi:type III secretion system FlhB-like substrate exporter
MLRPDLAEKPEKRKPIPASVRHDVWDLYFEKTTGFCYCCQREITIRSWEAGHIQAAALKGPDTVENLVPICSSCNKSMSTTNMIEFALTYYPETAPVLSLDAARETLRKIKKRSKRDKIAAQAAAEIEEFSLSLELDDEIAEENNLGINEIYLFVQRYDWTGKVEARTLHRDYKKWAQQNNCTPMSVQSKEFRSSLKDAGVKSTNIEKKRYYYLA